MEKKRKGHVKNKLSAVLLMQSLEPNPKYFAPVRTHILAAVGGFPYFRHRGTIPQMGTAS